MNTERCIDGDLMFERFAIALAARSEPTFAKGTKTTSVTRQSTNGKRIFIMPND